MGEARYVSFARKKSAATGITGNGGLFDFYLHLWNWSIQLANNYARYPLLPPSATFGHYKLLPVMSASLLTSFPLIGSVSPADQELFLAGWQERTVAEGEVLSEAGAICQEVFFIQQGVLRLVARAPQGKEITHSFRQQGQLCTLLASFEQRVPATLRIQAACPARVLAIDRARLEDLSRQLPYLPGLLTQLIRQELLAKLHLQRAYLGQDAEARYQFFLQHQPEVARCVPQHMIASYLGITPQSLSRLRKASC